MMARNLRVFLKVYAEIKRKSKKELENFTQALIMDKKMEEIEKQNLENRMFILGGTNPTRFFNTH
jgi:Ethanolamine utilization protein EutJ (predicted chaperonin)